MAQISRPFQEHAQMLNLTYKMPQKHLTVFEMKCFKVKVEKFINTDRYIPMLTKLQTAVCTMTVSMEAPRRGKADF
jgi:hypothetical protein